MRTVAKLFLAGIVAFLPLAILYGWLTATFRPTSRPASRSTTSPWARAPS